MKSYRELAQETKEAVEEEVFERYGEPGWDVPFNEIPKWIRQETAFMDEGIRIAAIQGAENAMRRLKEAGRVNE